MVLWSMLVVAAAVGWPGPVAHAPYRPLQEHGIRPTAQPPTDRSGSTMIFAGDEQAGSAAVFWEIPAPGKVRITIELDSSASSDDLPGPGGNENGGTNPEQPAESLQ